MTIVTRIREFEYSRERGRFRSWLKGVAIHKATDILRSRGREVSAERVCG